MQIHSFHTVVSVSAYPIKPQYYSWFGKLANLLTGFSRRIEQKQEYSQPLKEDKRSESDSGNDDEIETDEVDLVEDALNQG
jgi:hypothetical protein